MQRLSRLPLMLIPVCLPYLMYYSSLSRGYIMGALCFFLFLVCAQRLHTATGRMSQIALGVLMALFASISIGAVLSNGMYVVGASVGFGIMDLVRRHFKLLVVRIGWMLGGALFLVSWHPAVDHLENFKEFNAVHGTQLTDLSAVPGVFWDFMTVALAPMPLFFLVMTVIGLGVMIYRRNAWVVALIGAMVPVPIAWAVGGNAQFARTYVSLLVVVVLAIQAILVLILDTVEEELPRPVFKTFVGALWLWLGWLVVMQGFSLLENHMRWVNGFDGREWRQASREGSLNLLPWSEYMVYRWEQPEAEKQTRRLYDARHIDEVLVLGYPRAENSWFVASDYSRVPNRFPAPFVSIDRTDRGRQAIRDVRYLGEWSSPESSGSGLPECADCVVLLLTSMQYYGLPRFPDLKVSDTFFYLNFRTEGDDQWVRAHLVFEPGQTRQAVDILLADSARTGPVRAFTLHP